METAGITADRRRTALIDWLDQLGGFDTSSLRPASGDASFRRYFRVDRGETTCIVMDAPPDKEDCGSFLHVAELLQRMGLHGPGVLSADQQRGFVLLTDLGSRQYLDELRQHPDRADALYGDALRALATLQVKGIEYQRELPPYDEKLLRFELSLFSEWLCARHLGITLTPEESAAWQDTCDLLVANAATQTRVFVHRDYHSRNLMVVDVNNPGILDFQDAVEGPLTYDLVSLLKDCYIRWPQERILGWACAFHDLLPRSRRPERGGFLRAFELMGVQRQLKAAGIFARLRHRDGKPDYLNDVPRTLGYIVEVAPRHPQLEFIAGLITRRCLPALPEQPG